MTVKTDKTLVVVRINIAVPFAVVRLASTAIFQLINNMLINSMLNLNF